MTTESMEWVMNERVAGAIRELEAFIDGRDDAMAIPREAGAFLHALLRATGARSGVEIGTSFGYSALWAAAALETHGGTLVTIDKDPRKHETARRFFDTAGLGRVIRCEAGVATDVLEREAGPFDYALIDADKANCIRYAELLIPKLTDRAMILTDNTRTHAEELAPFRAWIGGRSDFVSTNVPVGNGMEMSVYTAAG